MTPFPGRDLAAEFRAALARVLARCSGEDLAWDAWARDTLEREGLARPFAAMLLVSVMKVLGAIRAALGESDPMYVRAHARAATLRLVFASWMRKVRGRPSREALAVFDEALAEIVADLNSLHS